MTKPTSAVTRKMVTRSLKSQPSLYIPYFQMIIEAISALKEREGSSQTAITKAIEERHKNQLSPSFKKSLSLELKKLVESKKLVKVKTSYKIVSNDLHQKSKKLAKIKRLSQVKTPEGMKKKLTKGKR